jgi:hypothetical protein
VVGSGKLCDHALADDGADASLDGVSERRRDFVVSLRRDRVAARAVVEEKLAAALRRLDREPVIAEMLRAVGGERVELVHYTFDEPDCSEARAEVQFTYHLAVAAGGDGGGHEIRGSGIAVLDSDGGVRLEGMDAELYRMDGDGTVMED